MKKRVKDEASTEKKIHNRMGNIFFCVWFIPPTWSTGRTFISLADIYIYNWICCISTGSSWLLWFGCLCLSHDHHFYRFIAMMLLSKVVNTLFVCLREQMKRPTNIYIGIFIQLVNGKMPSLILYHFFCHIFLPDNCANLRFYFCRIESSDFWESVSVRWFCVHIFISSDSSLLSN